MSLRLQLKFIQLLCLLLELCNGIALLPKLGEECNITRSRAQGVCTLVDDCPVPTVYSLTLSYVCDNSNTDDIVVCCAGATLRIFKTQSASKCQEYSTNITCGAKHLSEISLIENRLKSVTDFPHIGIIQYKTDGGGRLYFDDHGVLISARYVICAAVSLFHHQFDRTAVSVRFGSLDKGIWIDYVTVEYDIEKTIIHPGFHPPAIYNEIGLIKLSKQVTFTQNVRPICLPDSDSGSLSSIVYRINYESTNNTSSLVKYERKLVPNEICNATYGSYNAPRGINEDFICSIPRELGDSNYKYTFHGAPITIDSPSGVCSHVLLGISLVVRIGRISDVAAKVYNYREWIEDIVFAEGADTEIDWWL